MVYRLPVRYRRNMRPVPFDDHAPITGHCEGWEWQPDVYPHAVALAERFDTAPMIVDVGCGAARKLAPYVDRFDVTGLDRPEIVDQIATPGRWLPADFEGDDPLQVSTAGPVVWICSDVIEHLVHPERLVRALRERLTEHPDSVLVLSTPDRVRTRGAAHRGPSPNRGHVQEWTLAELCGWLEDEGLTVRVATHTRSNDHEPDEATCLVEVTADVDPHKP